MSTATTPREFRTARVDDLPSDLPEFDVDTVRYPRAAIMAEVRRL